MILGGDDLTQHGGQDGSGNSLQGWIYMEKAIGNLKPNVTRPNDNSIAALGSAFAPSTASGNSGGAITNAAEKNGMTVQYFNSEAQINTAFAGIADGSYTPAIVWVAGDDGSNDLSDTGCSGPGTEGQAIIDNVSTLDIFVSQGGGLMSHGTCYDWLSALLPGLSTNSDSSDEDLYLTPEGQSAFPGLTDAEINAGPWHNHFRGDFGGLQVLARSSDIDDDTGADAAVILGGAAVGLLTPPPSPSPPAPPGSPYTQGVPCANQIRGNSKNNNLKGTDGSDSIKGRGGNDKIKGAGGDDCLRGGPGRDRVKGGDGDDQLNGGQKPDILRAGPGDDVIKAVAGQVDKINCGPGDDTVRAQKKDKVNKNCETVKLK